MEPELSPEEIRGADFSVVLRGYDRREVEAFLQDVAAEVAVLRESSEKSYLTAGEELGELLQHAKDIADKLLLDAQNEAATLTQNAAEEAAEMKDSAETYAKHLREQVETEAADSRSEANRKYLERIRSADTRVQELGVEENQARQRISALRTELEEVAKSLLQVGADGTSAEAEPDGEEPIIDIDRQETVRTGAVSAPPLGTTQINGQDDGGTGSGITWLKQHL